MKKQNQRPMTRTKSDHAREVHTEASDYHSMIPSNTLNFNTPTTVFISHFTTLSLCTRR